MRFYGVHRTWKQDGRADSYKQYVTGLGNVIKKIVNVDRRKRENCLQDSQAVSPLGFQVETVAMYVQLMLSDGVGKES